MTHQLVEQRVIGTALEVVARCGAAETRRPQAPLPAGFSAWHQDVDCPGCRPGLASVSRRATVDP